MNLIGFPVASYRLFPVLENFGSSLDTFIVFPVLMPFCCLLYYLLNEKEYRLKEYMKIMGLTDTAYYASWLFHYNIYFIVLGIVISILLK